MRDRLIGIVKSSLMMHIGKSCNLAENIVDDLLNENVIVPPCKVGDAVWYIEKNGGIACSLIEKIRMEQKAGWNTETVFNLIFIAGFGVPIFFEQIGEIIFLTQEEAEQALKERTDK